MSGQPPPPPRTGGGMSLYANLLEPKAAADPSAASISRAPVVFNQAGSNEGAAAAAKKPVLDPATLRFQPIRRPQLAAQKQKPKPTGVGFPKIPGPASAPGPAAAGAAGAPTVEVSGTTQPAPPPQPPPATAGSSAPPSAAQSRSRLADWVGTAEDEEYAYVGAAEKRQRGGKRAKKRQQRQGGGNSRHQTETNWDELYDPARPTNVEEYLRSDERIAEIREWKGVLYAHRRRRRRMSRSRSGSRETQSDEEEEEEVEERNNNKFAPPPSYSFAPPLPSPPRAQGTARSASAAATGVASTVPDDATGDDAYARRMALSGLGGAAPPPAPPSPLQAERPRSRSPLPQSAPPMEKGPGVGTPPAAAASAAAGVTISRAAVRYDPSSAPEAMDLDEDEDDEDGDYDYGRPPPIGAGTDNGLGVGEVGGHQQQQRASNRPGQVGFAERMMTKMGWQKGSGLGADGSGIVTGLRVQIDRKRRRRPDAEGGGFAEPAGKGRIVGGDKTTTTGAGAGEGKFGKMSEVVVLRGMLEGMEDLEGEVEGGLAQEIGGECGDKYGRVERLYIDLVDRQVFIKFTDQVSALRAVNALEGRVFNGNTIIPSFYDTDKFECGVYQ